MPERTLRVILSWHTSTDLELVDALASILRIHGFSPEYLPMLPNGLPSAESPHTVENWVDTFLGLLNGSIGLLAIFSEHGRASYYHGGMALERALCWNSLSERERDECYKEVIAPYPEVKKTPEEISRIIEGAEDRGIDVPADAFERYVALEKETPNFRRTSEWANSIYQQISGWLGKRSAIGPVSVKRYRTAECNFDNAAAYELFEKQYPYRDDPWESALYRSDWCDVSKLSTYVRVWHCRRCRATSDAWDMTKSRPPEACPACGFGGSKQ